MKSLDQPDFLRLSHMTENDKKKIETSERKFSGQKCLEGNINSSNHLLQPRYTDVSN